MKTYIIKIEFTPGSKWQEELKLSTIRMMIAAWKDDGEMAHKKNIIKVEELVKEK